MRLTISVVPNASKTELVGVLADGATKIRLAAAPVDGKANDELIHFLSKHFKTPKNKITILKGLRGKKKLIEIL